MKNKIPSPISQLAPLNGIRVLMAEDNEINGMLACRFMEIWGVICDIVSDGFLAIEKVQSKNYDIIFMDLQMPGIDGFEASKTIRNLAGTYFQNIPIIAISASNISDIKSQALEAGINDFVEKPFDLVDLHQKINFYGKPAVNRLV